MKPTLREFWDRLRRCRKRPALVKSAGPPDRTEREHPREDWTESWDYDASERATGIEGFTVRLDGDAIYAIDTRWSKDPEKRTAKSIERHARGATADEVFERLGFPDEWSLRDGDEIWFYWIARDAVRPDGSEIAIRNGTVRAIRKPDWFP